MRDLKPKLTKMTSVNLLIKSSFARCTSSRCRTTHLSATARPLPSDSLTPSQRSPSGKEKTSTCTNWTRSPLWTLLKTLKWTNWKLHSTWMPRAKACTKAATKRGRSCECQATFYLRKILKSRSLFDACCRHRASSRASWSKHLRKPRQRVNLQTKWCPCPSRTTFLDSSVDCFCKMHKTKWMWESWTRIWERVHSSNRNSCLKMWQWPPLKTTWETK